MKKKRLSAIALAVVMGVGAKAAYAGATTVVAKVNDKKITLKQLEDQKQLVPMLKGAQIEAIFAPLREQAVMGEIISQAADKADISKEAEFKKKIAEIRKGLIREMYLMREARKLVSKKDIEARYNDLKSKFKAEEEIDVSLIAVKTEKEATDVVDALKKKAKTFEVLAQEKSMLPNAKAGGKVGFQVKGALPPALAGAAFALKKGDFTKKPVKVDGGFFVLKAGEKRMTKAPSIEEATGQIEEMLVSEKVKEVVQKLRSTSKVELFKLDGTPDAVPAKS